MSRLRRFLHIERSRTEPAAPPAGEGAAARRIGTVERPSGAPSAQAGSGAGLERFGPGPPPSVDVAPAGPGEQPFTRCMRCGMDHHRLATECAGCGARLDAPAQRAFNERLWADRQAEAAREARADEERRAQAGAEAADLAVARRRMAEELAREVGRRERLRLDAELGGRGWDAAVSLLRRLLDRLLRRRGPSP